MTSGKSTIKKYVFTYNGPSAGEFADRTIELFHASDEEAVDEVLKLYAGMTAGNLPVRLVEVDGGIRHYRIFGFAFTRRIDRLVELPSLRVFAELRASRFLRR